GHRGPFPRQVELAAARAGLGPPGARRLVPSIRTRHADLLGDAARLDPRPVHPPGHVARRGRPGGNPASSGLPLPQPALPSVTPPRPPSESEGLAGVTRLGVSALPV